MTLLVIYWEREGENPEQINSICCIQLQGDRWSGWNGGEVDEIEL